MEERRRLERFDLQAPTRIEVELDGGKKSILSLATKDISSDGAFIATDRPLPEGQTVKLELLLSLDILQKFVGEKGRAKIRVKGKVIRSVFNGMAILFDSKYKILTSSGVVAH
jgi:hypothetical protein